MASTDLRPLGVKALSLGGIIALCTPATIATLALIAKTEPGGFLHDRPTSVLLVAAIITALLAPLAALIAQMANPLFDMRRPHFSEFLTGIVMAPVWLISNVVAIALTAFFVAAAFGAVFFLVRHV